MSKPVVVNGWNVYVHPLLLQQINKLILEIERCKSSDPENWESRNCSKRLKAILKLITEDVPANPNSSRFRPGNALGTSGRKLVPGQVFSGSIGCFFDIARRRR